MDDARAEPEGGQLAESASGNRFACIFYNHEVFRRNTRPARPRDDFPRLVHRPQQITQWHSVTPYFPHEDGHPHGRRQLIGSMAGKIVQPRGAQRAQQRVTHPRASGIIQHGKARVAQARAEPTRDLQLPVAKPVKVGKDIRGGSQPLRAKDVSIVHHPRPGSLSRSQHILECVAMPFGYNEADHG